MASQAQNVPHDVPDSPSSGTPGSQSGSAPSSAQYSGAEISTTNEPIDTLETTTKKNASTLAEMYANYYSGIATGSLGGLGGSIGSGGMTPMDTASLPSESVKSNVLQGNFGNALRNRKVLIVIGIVALVVAWYFWRKRRVV